MPDQPTSLIQELEALRVAADEVLIVRMDDIVTDDASYDAATAEIAESLEKLLPGRWLLFRGAFEFTVAKQ